jgi:hypothetical protein
MKWVRAKAKRLSLLALFALAIQLGLSFGHMHRDLSWPTSHTQAVASSSSSSIPANQPDADDICAICFTVALASSVMHSAPPVLAVPAQFSRVTFDNSSLSSPSLPRLAAFRSRAPPLLTRSA